MLIAKWLERVGSSIPRGFSRYFILDLLRVEPHTGMEIIETATKQSQGLWRPSPGLVYPLLGRLLDEGLIEESGDGKYKITERGSATVADLEKINDTVRTQLDVLFRIGNVGRFAAMDVLERISTMGSILSSNIMSMTENETHRYRKFLESEIKKVDAEIARREAEKADSSS